MISTKMIKLLELVLVIMHPGSMNSIHDLNLVGGAFFKALENAFGLTVLTD